MASKPQPKTLVAILGPAAALALMIAVPREESGRTVTAEVTPSGHVALTHVRGHEYLTAYLDTVGVHTACDGLTRNPDGSPIRAGQRFTEAQCDAMLEAELTDEAAHVMTCAPGLEGHDGPKVASVLLTHNIGWPRFCSSTARARFTAGQYVAGCDAFLMWKNAGGKPILLPRRERERAICLKGIA